MANSVEIPQDIIDNVIAALGDNKRTLKQCALVSSSFLPPSRKQLFCSISLGSKVKACDKLHQALVQNPVNQSFVRRIFVTHQRWGSTPTFDQTVLAILQLPFCHLEEFTLCDANWGRFSGELKDALSILIHSPTLKILYLRDVHNPPITLFHGIVQLTKLQLSSVSLDYSGGEQPSSPTTEGVATAVSHTVVDQCVWFFSYPTHDSPTEAIFLPFMSHLRILEINIHPGSATMSDFAILSFLMSSLCASLTSPATLEHVKLNIGFQGNDNFFNHDSFYWDLGHDAVWRNLDSIVIHPAGSRLQRVDIDIQYSFRYDDNIQEPDNDEILEAILDGLPRLRDKGILFVEAKDYE